MKFLFRLLLSLVSMLVLLLSGGITHLAVSLVLLLLLPAAAALGGAVLLLSLLAGVALAVLF